MSIISLDHKPLSHEHNLTFPSSTLIPNLANNLGDGEEEEEPIKFYGNKGEISSFNIYSGVGTFIKDSPYVIEFPVAPTSLVCSYYHGSRGRLSRRSLDVILENTKATIETSNLSQQREAFCEVIFNEEIAAQQGILKFGKRKTAFVMTVENIPVVTNGSLSMNDGIQVSGTASANLAASQYLAVSVVGTMGYVINDAICTLEYDEKKIPISLTAVNESYLNFFAYFDLEENPIPEATKFSINCAKETVEVLSVIKDNNLGLLLAGSSSYTRLYANSATFIGTTTAVLILSAASIISLFF